MLGKQIVLKKFRIINVNGIYLLHAGQNILQFGDYFE